MLCRFNWHEQYSGNDLLWDLGLDGQLVSASPILWSSTLSQFPLQALKAAAHSTNTLDCQPVNNGMLLLTSSLGLGHDSSEVPHSSVYAAPVNFSPQVVPQFHIGLSESLGAAQPVPSLFYGCYSLPDVTVTPLHVQPARNVMPAAKHTIDTKSVCPPTKTVSQNIL